MDHVKDRNRTKISSKDQHSMVGSAPKSYSCQEQTDTRRPKPAH